MPGALRLAYVGSPDLHALLHGAAATGTGPTEAFADVVSPSTTIQLSRLVPGGWASTLELLRARPSTEEDRFDVLLTSASAELEDPSREPRAALVELAGFVSDRLDAHTVVLNASTLQPAASERSGAPEPDEPASLRIRRIDLAIMEASHESGLSVLDADRLTAEIRLEEKVRGPYEYAPEINGALRSMLASILGELGFAQRSLMEAHTPYIRQVVAISVEEWLKSEGEVVASGDVLCRLRLSGLRRFKRPSTATVLASINGHVPMLRRIVSRERVSQRNLDGVVSLVAGDGAVLRRVTRPAGATVQPGELLAVLSGDPSTPIDGADLKPTPFRAAVRTDDARLEGLL